MTSDGLGEMFEGDSADTCTGKFPLMLIGCGAEGLACTDPGARTPIGVSRNFGYFYIEFGPYCPRHCQLYVYCGSRIVLAIAILPFMDGLYNLHFAIRALTLRFASLLSISKPSMVNSNSHFRPRSGHKMLSSVMSISVPMGMTDVLSRLHCNPLISAKSFMYCTDFLRFFGVR